MIFISFDYLIFYLNMSAFNQALHLLLRLLLLLLFIPFYHIIHSNHVRSRYLIDLKLTRHPLILPQDPLLHTVFQMMRMMLMILMILINLFQSQLSCYFHLLLLSISQFYLLLQIFLFSP